MSDAIRVSPDDLLNKAKALQSQALELLQKPDFSKDDDTEVERLRAEAADLGKRSSKLREVMSAGQQYMAEQKAAFDAEREAAERNAPKEKFEHLGQMMVATRQYRKAHLRDPRLRWFDEDGPSEGHALSEGVGIDGGMLVQKEFANTMLQEMGERGLMRANGATIIPMARRQIEIPALEQATSSGSNPGWFAGIVVYWEKEAATITQTQPTMRMVELTAHKIAAYILASDELLADSAQSVAALITGPNGFPGAVAWAEDYAFINGDGLGKPLGFLNSGALVEATRTGDADTTEYEDIIEMMNHMLPSANYIWLATLQMRQRLMNMQGPSGNTDKMFLWGDPTNGRPDRLGGYPIIFTEKLPAPGNAGDLCLVDPSHYFIGDRQTITMDLSDQVKWFEGQTAFKVNHRVGGRPWIEAPFTTVDSSTLSPFITLEAA